MGLGIASAVASALHQQTFHSLAYGPSCFSAYSSDRRNEEDERPVRPRPQSALVLAAPSAPARNDVDQREERDDDHRGDGDDRDGGRSDDHVPFLSGRLLVKTTRRRAQRSVEGSASTSGLPTGPTRSSP